MDVTLREMRQAERDEAQAEMVASAAESAAGEYGKRLTALRRRLDDLVLQVAVVQEELEAGDLETAQVELNDLWFILNAVDRCFRNLPAA